MITVSNAHRDRPQAFLHIERGALDFQGIQGIVPAYSNQKTFFPDAALKIEYRLPTPEDR